MELILLSVTLTICRLDPNTPIPAWAIASNFYSLTRSPEELSIVCETAPADVKQQSGWRAFKVRGPLDFSLAGILAAVIEPLRHHRIPVFVISTFDTDHILVQAQDLEPALASLKRAGHTITVERSRTA